MKRSKEWIEELRSFLKKGVFGQDEAIDTVCAAIKRATVVLPTPEGP